MKYFLNAIFIIASLFTVSGCECYPVEKGIILDETTHLPIENAQIKLGRSTVLSDKIGQFNISSSGCKLKLIITADGYKPFATKIMAKNNKISIETDNETTYIDLEKPEYLNDSSTYLTSKLKYNNSTHFEYMGGSGSLKIYLSKIEK